MIEVFSREYLGLKKGTHCVLDMFRRTTTSVRMISRVCDITGLHVRRQLFAPSIFAPFFIGCDRLLHSSRSLLSPT